MRVAVTGEGDLEVQSSLKILKQKRVSAKEETWNSIQYQKIKNYDTEGQLLSLCVEQLNKTRINFNQDHDELSSSSPFICFGDSESTRPVSCK
jgi:hypothetical protein